MHFVNILKLYLLHLGETTKSFTVSICILIEVYSISNIRPRFHGLDPPDSREGSDDPRVKEDPHFPRIIHLGKYPCNVTVPDPLPGL
jgi:hypothetical protein